MDVECIKDILNYVNESESIKEGNTIQAENLQKELYSKGQNYTLNAIKNSLVDIRDLGLAKVWPQYAGNKLNIIKIGKIKPNGYDFINNN